MTSPGMVLPGQDKQKPLSFRQREVIELSLIMPPMEVAELTGYSLGGVHAILKSDKAVAHKQQIFDLYDEEFKNLFPEVIASVKKGLASTDVKESLQAAKIWLKAHGKFVNKEESQNVFSAEKMVVQILQQAERNQKGE